MHSVQLEVDDDEPTIVSGMPPMFLRVEAGPAEPAGFVEPEDAAPYRFGSGEDRTISPRYMQAIMDAAKRERALRLGRPRPGCLPS